MSYPRRQELTKEYLMQEYVIKEKSIEKIAREIGCSAETVYRRMVEYNIPIRRHKGFGLKVDYNKKRDLAYIIGVVLGDGWVRNGQIGLNVNDSTFARTFKTKLENVGLSPTMKQYKKQWVVVAYNKEFSDWLRRLTLDEIKKLLTDHENITAFIQGIYDSDGGLETSGSKYNLKMVRIYNTSLELLEMVRSLLNRIGIFPTISSHHKKGRRTFIDGKVSVLKKDVYVLNICRQKDVRKFLRTVGSSIPRKKGKDWLREYKGKWWSTKEVTT